MKVLVITPYITSSAHPGFLRNNTGFGIMVDDIARHMGEKCSIELFAVNAMTPRINHDSFISLGRSWRLFISNISLRNLGDALGFIRKYSLPFKEKLRVIYQFLAVSQAEKIMEDYDIVHIHGCSPITAAAVKACRRKSIPFVVTLHGLVSFEKAVRLHDSLKRFEKDFLTEAYLNDYNVTFISSGIKRQAEEYVTSNIAKE